MILVFITLSTELCKLGFQYFNHFLKNSNFSNLVYSQDVVTIITMHIIGHHVLTVGFVQHRHTSIISEYPSLLHFCKQLPRKGYNKFVINDDILKLTEQVSSVGIEVIEHDSATVTLL